MFDKILGYVPEFWMRRWYMLGWAWVFCVVGWFAVAFVPDRFESTARVYVDTESMLKPLLRGLAVDTNTLQQIEVMKRTLITRPNLEKVARLVDLDVSVKNQLEADRLISHMRKNITILSDRSNLFTFSYRHGDAAIAKGVVEALLKIFVESNLGNSRKRLDSAAKFIDEQLEYYGGELNKSENALAEFKRLNADILPGGANYHATLARLKSAYETNNSQYRDAVNRLRSLQSQLAAVPEYIASNNTNLARRGPPAIMESRMYEVAKKIDDLLLKYTKQHPDVINAKLLYEDLKQKFDAEQEALMKRLDEDSGDATGQRMVNPNYQTLQLQVVQQRAETAMLAGQVARRKAKIDQLKAKSDKVPGLEAELNKLTRDYGVIKRNYEQLLGRKETASISGSRDTKGEKVQFRIVDPPRLAGSSSGIKRSLLLSGVFLAALGSAAFIGMLIVKFDVTIFSTQRLVEVSGYRVLGEVMMETGIGRRLSHSIGIAAFLSFGMLLVSSYGGLMYLERQIGVANVLPEQVKERVVSAMPSRVMGLIR